jgi:SAM-dependent methyltransferase
LSHQTSETIVAQTLKEEGISRSSRSSGGYDPYFFDRLAQVEERHFWFCARNRLILGLARRISSTLKPCNRVLEIGCGTGNVLRALEVAFPNSSLVGLELCLEGLKHARTRSNAHLVQADIRNSPFSKQFDLVGMFDVLEHIAEDQGTLRLIHNTLRPGGKLLLTVPAHQSLWSYFDEAGHHCRRYSSQDIRQKLIDAGFQVEFLSQFMATIFPMVWIFRKMRMRGVREQSGFDSVRSRTQDEFRIVPVVNLILTGLLTLEARWVARGHHLPIGTSLVVVARRPA